MNSYPDKCSFCGVLTFSPCGTAYEEAACETKDAPVIADLTRTPLNEPGLSQEAIDWINERGLWHHYEDLKSKIPEIKAASQGPVLKTGPGSSIEIRNCLPV